MGTHAAFPGSGVTVQSSYGHIIVGTCKPSSAVWSYGRPGCNERAANYLQRPGNTQALAVFLCTFLLAGDPLVHETDDGRTALFSTPAAAPAAPKPSIGRRIGQGLLWIMAGIGLVFLAFLTVELLPHTLGPPGQWCFPDSNLDSCINATAAFNKALGQPVAGWRLLVKKAAWHIRDARDIILHHKYPQGVTKDDTVRALLRSYSAKQLQDMPIEQAALFFSDVSRDLWPAVIAEKLATAEGAAALHKQQQLPPEGLVAFSSSGAPAVEPASAAAAAADSTVTAGDDHAHSMSYPGAAPVGDAAAEPPASLAATTSTPAVDHVPSEATAAAEMAAAVGDAAAAGQQLVSSIADAAEQIEAEPVEQPEVEAVMQSAGEQAGIVEVPAEHTTVQETEAEVQQEAAAEPSAPPAAQPVTVQEVKLPEQPAVPAADLLAAGDAVVEATGQAVDVPDPGTADGVAEEDVAASALELSMAPDVAEEQLVEVPSLAGEQETAQEEAAAAAPEQPAPEEQPQAAAPAVKTMVGVQQHQEEHEQREVQLAELQELQEQAVVQESEAPAVQEHVSPAAVKVEQAAAEAEPVAASGLLTSQVSLWVGQLSRLTELNTEGQRLCYGFL